MKTSSTILFLLFSLGLLAQAPTITQENYFQLGEQYIRLNKFDTELNAFTPGASGVDVVWDFSTMDFNHPSVSEDTITVMEPYFTPFFDEESINYNQSNFCLKTDTEPFDLVDNDYHYFLLQNDSLQFIGHWANNGGWEQWFYSFDDFRTELIFPMNFQDEFTDYFESSYNDLSGSDWHYQSGESTVVATGYGTFITPDNDTIENVLRVSTVIFTTDSNYFLVFRTKHLVITLGILQISMVQL